MIDRRKIWREVSQQRWAQCASVTHKSAGSSVLTRRSKEITDDTVKHLHELAETLLTTSADFKLVVSVHQAYVYTNDQPLIDQLDNMSILKQKNYARAVVGRPKNTVRLKNPKHKYRSYFKIIKLTAQQKSNLVNFLANQNSYVRISPALAKWVVEPFYRTQDYFFVDYDDESWLTMLGLVRPGLIRKTMQIIQDK
jgi:hypothetical protein